MAGFPIVENQRDGPQLAEYRIHGPAGRYSAPYEYCGAVFIEIVITGRSPAP
jgi:hypothetical protein